MVATEAPQNIAEATEVNFEIPEDGREASTEEKINEEETAPTSE